MLTVCPWPEWERTSDPRLRPVDESAEVLVDDWARLAMDLILLTVVTAAIGRGGVRDQSSRLAGAYAGAPRRAGSGAEFVDCEGHRDGLLSLDFTECKFDTQVFSTSNMHNAYQRD
ncbi:hypothetical protein GCM10009767_28500 [Kocuria aegyptia]|uniref:Uncharacterized protein n=1 Tax=Kocuria aegyptia TaxID=330943 RepID=A0ABP4X6E9_9MICC